MESDQNLIDIPEPEAPLVVEDRSYFKEPSSDRNLLVDMIQSLSQKICDALLVDRFVQKRHARRMTLVNKLISSPTPQSNAAGRSKKHEKFVVKLPLTVDSWNELDHDEIQIEMLRTVQNISVDYSWWKVKVHLDHFMSEQTKKTIARLDAEERGEIYESDDDMICLNTDRPSVVDPPSSNHLSSMRSECKEQEVIQLD